MLKVTFHCAAEQSLAETQGSQWSEGFHRNPYPSEVEMMAHAQV